ncbi:MAG: HAMP domain-containing protein, partial [Proteobacteria bacterium]|nr:HAMP domain-containing protein [Pseudomonadota bacterium]
MKISIRSSIGSKIIGGYLILVAILLLVGGISYNQLRTIESLVSNQVMETADARNLSKNIILESTYVSSLVNEYLLTTEKAQKVALRIVIKDTIQTIQEYMRQVSKRELSPDGRKILEKSRDVSLQCCEKIESVLQSYDREGGLHGKTKNLSDEFLDLHSRLTTLLLQFDKIEEELMYGSWDYARHNIFTVKRYILAFSVIAIVGGLLLGFVITLSITRPVSKLADALERYGSGDFNIRADVKGTDEIGFFAKKFNSMLEQINTSANELKRANLEMTERNLELDESRSRLQTLTDSTPDAVFLVDSDRKILDANKTFTKVFRYSPDEALALKIDDLCSKGTVKD